MMRKMSRWVGLLVLVLLMGACSQPDAQSETVETVDSATRTASGNTAVYTITPGESTARFELEEDLRSALTGWALGARITVVGTTDQVTGELRLDPATPATAELGEIRINAASLKTNEFMRNVAIRNQILHTDTYEYIIFQPTEIAGLPDQIAAGERVSFQIVGDLTIQDTTRRETFDVTATLVSADKIEGSAGTIIDREAYGLMIPSVANVTFVEEAVELYIDFVARTE